MSPNFMLPMRPAQASLLRLLATAASGPAAVERLHAEALSLGAAVSVLLLPDSHQREWRATSCAGRMALEPGPWLSAGEPPLASDGALNGGSLVVEHLAACMPELGHKLGAAHAVLVPIQDGERPCAALLLGYAQVPSDTTVRGSAALGDAFAIALVRGRQERKAGIDRDLRSLMDDVARSGATPLTLVPALERVCHGVITVFGADHAEVWQLDRGTRQLQVLASSDGQTRRTGLPVSADDMTALPAQACARSCADVVPIPADPIPPLRTLRIPLRGRRRGLGALVVDGVRLEPGSEPQVLESADEVGRHLSAVVENVQLLDELLQARGRLESVFQSLQALVAVLDGEGRILDVNRAFAERLGRPREDLVGELLSAMSGSAVATWAAAHAPPRSREDRALIEDTRLGGTFDASLKLLTGLDGSGGAVLIARDVTLETKLETERRDLARRLGQSEKLAALGQFVAGIAHELNNPLQGVLGHLELLTASRAAPPALRRDLNIVYSEAGRAARIVRNLLVFAGSGRIEQRRLQPNVVIGRALRLRAQALRTAGIELVRDLDKGLPVLRGDALLLQQALMNLVLNAEQAMNGPGRLTVRSRLAGNAVELTVEDTGPGLSPLVRERLFEPFFTTKDVGKGTGLGLAMAYGIVQAHGGAIEAARGGTGGARFTVTLPVSAPAVGSQPTDGTGKAVDRYRARRRPERDRTARKQR